MREGAGQGSTIITLKATDQDFGQNAEVSTYLYIYIYFGEKYATELFVIIFCFVNRLNIRSIRCFLKEK